MQVYSVDDITKVYDSFFREYFKDHPSADDIQLEYSEFKKELLTLMAEMSDEEFASYASQKKNFLKSKLLELSVPVRLPQKEPPGRPSLQGRKNFFFDFLRTRCSSKTALEGYMRDFKGYSLAELVKDGMIANLNSFGKGQDSQIAKEIKKMAALDKDFPAAVLSPVQALLRRDNKGVVRVLDFSQHDRTPAGQVLVSLFVTAFQSNIHGLRALADYLTELYSISYHLSLKTEHYLLLSNLAKYLQSLLIDVTTRHFDEDSSYHSTLLSHLFHTLHDDTVFRGFKVLTMLMIKATLEYCDSATIAQALTLRPEDNIAQSRHSLLDFVASYLEKDLVSYDSFDQHRGRFLKLISVAGYCLGCSLDCSLVSPDGSVSNVITPFSSAEERSYLIIVPSERKTVFGYNESNKALIEAMRKAEPTYGLEDFCSVSDNNEGYTPKGRLRRTRPEREVRRQPCRQP